MNRDAEIRDRRAVVLGLPLVASFFIAGCAHKRYGSNLKDAEQKLWTGRISLQIQSDPPQAFFAGFELKGNAERGELLLTSPIGNVLGVMRWAPNEAVLESGGDVKRYTSIDALLEQSTGAAIPIAALFGWLNGENISASGWLADLSGLDNGRLAATRAEPVPEARLRIVLDQ